MKFVVFIPGEQSVCNSTALHNALSLKTDNDEICAVSFGDTDSDPSSFGVQYSVILDDESFNGSDQYAISRILAAFLDKQDGPFMVLTDMVAGYELLVPILAGLLGTQQFCYAKEFSRFGDGFHCIQDYGDFMPDSVVPECSIIQFIPVNIMLTPSPATCDTVSFDRLALGLGRFSVGKEGSRTFEEGGE